ncbi:MAG: PLAT/LH2 domain-containing protein [Octadecabacter sp.]
MTFRSLYLSAALTALCPLPAMAYTLIAVQTSDNVGGAGTDSNIYVKLYGNDGETTRLRLQDIGPDGNILEKGDFDIFGTDQDIGTAVVRMTLESDGLYSGSDWHLDRIWTITYDPTAFAGGALVAMNANVIASFLSAGIAIPDSLLSGIGISSFTYEDWITSEATEVYTSDDGQTPRPGVMLYRREAIADPLGEPQIIEVPVVVLDYANALVSGTPETKNWELSVTRSDSVTVTDETSQELSLGFSATAGYAAPDTGGGYGEVTLSAEYAYLRANVTERSRGTETVISVAEDITAEPGTIQFRIQSGVSLVSQQAFQSLLQDRTFTGYYVREAPTLSPTGVTFTKGVLEDDKWNGTVAGPFATTRTQGEYDQMVALLRSHAIVSVPLSYTAAGGQ